MHTTDIDLECLAAIGLRTFLMWINHFLHLRWRVLHRDCLVVCQIYVAELVFILLFVRANEVSYDTWSREFVYLITEGLARAIKIIFVRIRLFHESICSNDALVSSAFLAWSLCRTSEAEMVTNLKFKVALHVIKVVLRRNNVALDLGNLFVYLHFLISNSVRFIVICDRLNSLFFNWTTSFYFWRRLSEIWSKWCYLYVVSLLTW